MSRDNLHSSSSFTSPTKFATSPSPDGLMDIGKHCEFCGQLDFLPFTCSKCKLVLCSNHRSISDHYCKFGDKPSETKNDGSSKKMLMANKNNQQSVASLFPDRKKFNESFYEKNNQTQIKSDKVSSSTKLLNNNNQNNNQNKIKSNDKLFSVNAFNKIKFFLKVEKKLKKNNKKSFGNSFSFKNIKNPLSFNKNKSSSTASATYSTKSSAAAAAPKNTIAAKRLTSTQRIIELSKLKTNAKGDPKIPVSSRIYAWVVKIPDFNDNNDDTKNEKTIEEFFNKNMNKEILKPMYFSKTWPVGRVLDYIADELKIKNENNKINDKKFRLSIFRKIRDDEVPKNDDEIVYILPNGRVIKEIRDLDILYIVRGADI
ncbi:Cuz1p ASCRUDRAFT_75799 [Ascoidea rubescens DSM 1968]|uniref:AN1-type domain-containing protein n=1 Tax=Ascoidea rubescens DSM 1968 TaxID=1344418 RepID=A0A1D2VHD4_9ASCO|nr:hypothetical protein ASCRUDRAFT_75799 [Ascoidea rubescens DSM 1968]ODV61064.1 hypothetical protein ASCRUDRAFT_75799 [Ascoidea rubescens DSM 1968]